MEVEYTADSEKFSSSGFCDAYHCMLTGKSTNPNIANHWVIKLYNDKSKKAIASLFVAKITRAIGANKLKCMR